MAVSDTDVVERYQKVGDDQGISAPPSGVVAVTPADDTGIVTSQTKTVVLRAFRVGTTAGDVAVVMINGDTATIPNVQVGEVVVGRFKFIQATATTAVGITGFY